MLGPSRDLGDLADSSLGVLNHVDSRSEAGALSEVRLGYAIDLDPKGEIDV
jgi:hypothetical protein